jgi:hypothetical protein
MALYTYSLFLLRESVRGSFVDDLQRAGLIRTASSRPEEIELLGLGCTASIGQRPEGVTLIELAPDSDTFEKFLAERGHELVRWLWNAMDEAALLYAFIPGGGDFKYYENGVSTDTFVWAQLPELLQTGTVRVVHPLMMFSERLGNGRPCAKAKTLDWGLQESRDGVGCLLALTSPTDKGFEILEPGTMYEVLKQAWA